MIKGFVSNKLLRTLRPVLALGMAPAVLAACGSSSSLASSSSPSSTAASSSSTTVTIGYQNLGADPQAAVEAQNLFQKYMHAKVKLREFASGPDALPALASGSIQFMTGLGNPPAATAILHGLPVQVIWAQERYTSDEGLVVPKNSPIHSLKDLKGVSVAAVLGSTSTLAFSAGLSSAGISPSSVHLVNMTPPAIQAAWSTGSIKAAYTWDPFFDYMVEHGGRVIMTDGQVSNIAPIFNLTVVNKTWASSHASLVKEFIQAEEAGVQEYKSSPSTALAAMAKATSISVSLAKKEMAGYQIYDLAAQVSSSGMGEGSTVANSLVVKGLVLAAKQLISSGGASGPVPDMAKFVNPSYAAALVGKSQG